jgi:Ca2+-binding RTX toxin-like protein
VRRLPLTVIATTLALAFVPAPADAAKPVVKCQGKKATIVGTKGADTIRGTKKRDVIQARGGADVINGLGGNDVICGGGGRDQASGGTGADAIYLGARSVAFGGPGNDRVHSAGQGLLDGGPGKDVLRGGAGKDYFTGGTGDDTVIDSAGDNEVSDSSGRTIVRLGSGDDFVETTGYATIASGAGDDMVFGTGAIATGPGADFVQYKICTSCRGTDAFSVSLGPDNDGMTIGAGIGNPVVGVPVATSIDFDLDGGDGVDLLDDWFAVGTVTTAVGLGPNGSVSGPWKASEFDGFENYSANKDMTGDRVFDITGSNDPNYVNVFGSASFISGLGGDDDLGVINTPNHIDGGDGDDTCTSTAAQISCEN